MRGRQAMIVTMAAVMLTGLGRSDEPANPYYGDIRDLKLKKPEDKVDVKSTPAPKDAVVLFDGKNFDNWSHTNGKPVEWKSVGGAMQVQPGKGDIVTREKFTGAFKLHVEFRVPYLPDKKDQARGNSGVYLQGRYEVQILDSYGLEPKNNECGGIYTVATPKENACKAPTVWQSYDIEFTAPTCAEGKIREPGRMTVFHNGIKIHDDVKLVKDGKPVTNTTSGLGGDPCQPGPIMLQDHGSPVQYRNIWLVPMKKE
jgi:hypothetical protein